MMLYCIVLYCIVLYCIVWHMCIKCMQLWHICIACMHSYRRTDVQTYRHTDIRTYTRSMYIHIFNVGLQPKTRSSVLPLLFFTTCFRCWMCRVLIFCRINIQKSQEDLYGFMDPISKGYIYLLETLVNQAIKSINQCLTRTCTSKITITITVGAPADPNVAASLVMIFHKTCLVCWAVSLSPSSSCRRRTGTTCLACGSRCTSCRFCMVSQDVKSMNIDFCLEFSQDLL